ncbi:MAG: ABC transporter permease [Bacillota bacterium]|nr:ABC transporter permease [Bacillota bacterium]
MRSYLVRRTVATVGTTWLVATFIFLMVHMLPGDPAIMILSSKDETPTLEAVAAMRHRLGLDQPVTVQYARWFMGMLKGDFGRSLMTDRPVAQDLGMRIPRTISLLIPSLPLSVLLGIPLGVVSALNRGRIWDPLVSTIALIGVSTPAFVSALLLVLFFAINLRLVPSSGYVPLADDPVVFARHAILPVISLTLGPMAVIMRMTRSAVLEQIQMDYVRTAWAKGLTERVVIYKHVLKNALIPVVTIIGLSLGSLFSGSVVIEAIYNWPGLSSLLLRAVAYRDYPLVQGTILVVAVGFIVANLVTDLSYGFLDPRIRYN